METLEDYNQHFQQIDGVNALYIIHMDTKKIHSKIISSTHDKSLAIESIKSLSSYIKRGKFEMIYIESKENIFLKSISSKSIVLVVYTDKNLVLGSIFSILKKL
jgi:predicted regulator of Ras-like GTPase activity (Roadblock/LC7/MglB family)